MAGTLAHACLAQMTRVRDQVMPSYLEIGPPGLFALTLMRQALDATALALAEGDAIALLRLHEELKGFTV